VSAGVENWSCVVFGSANRYPQVNTLIQVDTNSDGSNPRIRSNPNHWLVTTGLWATCYHENGHSQLMSKWVTGCLELL
jgi:hypothetical protein